MRLFNNRLRILIAKVLLRWMAILPYYEPAKNTAPAIEKLLGTKCMVTSSCLRRLTLAVLLHWYDYAHYHGMNFTTRPRKPNDLRPPFPHILVFLLYNLLSRAKPIENSVDFEEQMGGFPPIQIDPVQNLVDFITNNRCIRIELVVGRDCFDVKEAVDVFLTIKNLTDTPITIQNRSGPNIRFVIEKAKGIILEHDYRSPKSTGSDDKIILSPETKIKISWKPGIEEEGHFLVRSQVYVPQYDTVADLVAEFYYGVKPVMTPVVITSFCTL